MDLSRVFSRIDLPRSAKIEMTRFSLAPFFAINPLKAEMADDQLKKAALSLAEEAQKGCDEVKILDSLIEVNEEFQRIAKGFHTSQDLNLKVNYFHMKCEREMRNTVAAVQKTGHNIEQWAKEMVVQYVGAKEPDLFIKDQEHTSLDELLKTAADVLGPDGLAEMQQKIIPCGWEVLKRNISALKHFNASE